MISSIKYDDFLTKLEALMYLARSLGLFRTTKKLHRALNEGRSERFEAQIKPTIVTGGGIFFQLLPVIIGDPPMATYKLPDDHPDEPYVLAPITAEDMEHNPLPLDPPVVESTDSNVVSVDPVASMIHIGGPGVATITETVKRTDTGEIIFADSANFLITAGATGAVAGGGISFPNLTPEP